jgi:hypothetical protein
MTGFTGFALIPDIGPQEYDTTTDHTHEDIVTVTLAKSDIDTTIRRRRRRRAAKAEINRIAIARRIAEVKRTAEATQIAKARDAIAALARTVTMAQAVPPQSALRMVTQFRRTH